MPTEENSWGSFQFSPSTNNNRILYMVLWENLIDFYESTSEEVLDRDTMVAIRDQLLGDFEARECCSFTEDTLQRFFEKTGCIVTERFGSATPGVEYVHIGRAQSLPERVQSTLSDITQMPEYPFEVQEFDGRRKTSFALIASRFLGPILQRKIILRVPHGRSYEYSPRGAFQVLIWSTPHHHLERTAHPPRRIWDIPISCGDEAFQPRVEHTEGSIFLKDGDYIVAELMENALYVHHDLVHNGEDCELELFARLLEKVAEQMVGSERWEEIRREAQDAFLKRQSETFAAFVQKAIPQRASRHEDEVRDAQEKADAARAACMEAERELFNLQQAINDPEQVAERFKTEFARLSEGMLDGISSVILHEHDGLHNISVRTTELQAFNPNSGKTHLLGRFEITLHLDTGRAKFKNLDRMYKGMDDREQPAPHVYKNGRPCLGNIETELATYIAHYELEAAIGLSIAFLQNGVDDNDALGRVIHSFPEVEPGEREGAEA